MDLGEEYKKHWNSSLGKSIALHLLLLLLALFFKLTSDPSETIETQYAVTVSFQEVEFTNSKSSNSTKSKSSEGAQRAKSESPKAIERPKPATIPVPKPPASKPAPPTPPVVSPEPTEPVISETTVEESDIQAVEEPIEVEAPEPEYIPQESPEPEPTEEVVISEPDLPTLDDIIGDITDDPIESEEEEVGSPTDEPGTGDKTSSGGGDGDSDPSLKDGDGGSGKGDSGTGKGSDADGNDGDSGKGTGGYGEGEFDDSGDGIFGREVIYQDPSLIAIATGSIPSGQKGKFSFKVCIDRSGTIKHLEINELLTTVKDPRILNDALRAMQKYKYARDNSAAREQCGTYTMTVDKVKGFN